MSDMTWCQGNPTRPGVYWYKEHLTGKAMIVAVFRTSDGGLGSEDLDHRPICDPVDGYWYGPLEPPQ